MKKLIIPMLVLVLFSGMQLAAEGSLPAVDIEEANSEIAGLEQGISDDQSAIQQANANISEEEVKSEELNKKLVEVDGYLNQILEEIKDLADFKKRVADADLGKQTDEALLRATGIKKSLRNERNALTSELSRSQEAIAENRRQIRVRNSTILKKQERILVLQTAIKVTEQQKQEAQTLFSNVDSIMTNAEKYISAE